jgi:hypothetical protein
MIRSGTGEHHIWHPSVTGLTSPFHITSTGRLVSNKPANAPFLAYQKYKEEQADIARRRAAGEVIPEERLQWSWSGALVTLVTLLCLTAAVGNFVTGSPVWGQAKQIHRLMDKVWAVSLSWSHPYRRLQGADYR